MIRRLIWAVGILLAVVVTGTCGYMVIEHWTVFDSLYMTVITVGTVGFGEVHPLSTAGRMFTVLLILAGVGALGFAFGQLIEFLLEGHLRSILEGRRMEKRLGTLSGHTIIAGCGAVGSVVARTLAEEGETFVVIDMADESALVARESDWAIVRGDATEEETLIRAEIAKASSIVTALSSDADNLFVTVSARSLNPGIFIVARSASESSAAKLRKAGANRTITPDVIGGRRMASMVLHPVVADYLDLVSHGGDLELRLEEIEIEKGSRLHDKTIGELRIRHETGALVLAIRRADGTTDPNPWTDTVLSAGDMLVAFGTPGQLHALRALS